MTNKVITQTVIVTGAVLPADVITKLAGTKEFMVIDYPRIGVDVTQTQQGSVIPDTAVKLLVHGNGSQVDSSSFARTPTQVLPGNAGEAITYPSSTPPNLGLGANYISIVGGTGSGSLPLNTPIFYYPVSADFLFDGRSGSIWELSFRYKCDTADAVGRTYRIARFGDNDSQNFSHSGLRGLKFYINSTVPPTFNIQWNVDPIVTTWDLSTTNFNASNLNHILVSNDGTTIRLFVNGIVHATTYPVSVFNDTDVIGNPFALFSGGDSAGELKTTSIDEIQLKVGGTVTTASFTAPTTEYTGTTGTAFYTASKVIIPAKRVLEFV